VNWIGPLVLQFTSYFGGTVFGLPSDSMTTPTAYALEEMASPYNYVTADDPPVWMYYSQVAEPTNSSEAIHHVNFGYRLKDKMDSVSVPCGVLTPAYTGSINQSAVDFFVYYLITNPLPVQLASFVGNLIDNNVVKLEWETVSEMKNFGFYVQKYNNVTKSFETVSELIPGAGTTLQPQSYAWTDNHATGSDLQYRLEQLDSDGLKHYFGPIMINPNGVNDEQLVPAVFKLNQNYPNPFNPSTKISFSLATSGYTSLKVYNILGKEVASLFAGNAEAGRMYNVNFDAKSITSGMYFYKLQSGNKTEVKKFTILK
jgi:hypothetical protein